MKRFFTIIATSVIATSPGALAPAASLPPIVVTGAALASGYLIGRTVEFAVRYGLKKFKKNGESTDTK